MSPYELHTNGSPKSCFELDDHFRIPNLLIVIPFLSIERHRMDYSEHIPGSEPLRVDFGALRASVRLILSLVLYLICLRRSALPYPIPLAPALHILSLFSIYLQNHHNPLSTLYLASSPFSFSTPTTPSTVAFTPAISSSIPIPPNTALHPT